MWVGSYFLHDPFSAHPLGLCSTELERPASQLFLHNLTGVLEAARRVTNWDPEDAEALERLDVKLMEVGSIELDRVKIVG